MSTQGLLIIKDGNFDLLPSLPGVYSWFFPLVVYNEDTLESFFSRVEYVLKYRNYNYASNENLSYEEMQIQKFENIFAFGKTEIYKKDFLLKLKEEYASSWESLRIDEVAWKNFKNQLLDASIYLKPLYIGKADNLRNRINQHINYRTTNSFGFRFEQYIKKMPPFLGLNNKNMSGLVGSVNVNDLHLSVLPFKDELKSENNKLIEKLLQHLIQPNFSER